MSIHRLAMRLSKTSLLPSLLILGMIALSINLSPQFSVNDTTKTQHTNTKAQYAKLPLAFEPNRGQANDSIDYLVHHGKATTYFDGATATTVIGDKRVAISLDGASIQQLTGTDQLPSKTNYFIGNDQSKWQPAVPNFGQLIASNVYPGIDLRYYGTNSQLEHDFIVSPGADHTQIAFHIDGQDQLTLDTDGNININLGDEVVRLNAPATYQQTRTTKQTIPSHYELNGNTVSIALNSDYDHAQPLIIDPLLVYSTYVGGSTGDDQGAGIAVDSSGNAYIAGTTSSTNYPTSSPYQGSYNGNQDAFVTKMNANGSALVYSTYLGGSSQELGFGIAVDSSDSAYVVGATSSGDFPTASPFQGSGFSFITKLDPSGSSLVYSSYAGGNGGGFAAGVAVDGSGNAYIVGRIPSADLVTVGAIQPSYGGGGEDGYLTKIDSSGTSIVYSTYLGGSAADNAYGIAVDGSGNAFISGSTASSDFPTNAAFQPTFGGGTQDAFIAEIDAAGSSLVYSSYLGGSGDEQGTGIGIDASGNAITSGATDSTDFPTLNPYQAFNNASRDSFVTKVDSTGALSYSTYLGGTGDELGYAIAVDPAGYAYPTGVTCSFDFPIASPFQATPMGGCEIYVAKLNPSGSTLSYSTYIGGSGFEFGLAIAIGPNGNAYVTGDTRGSDFPTNVPFGTPFQASFSGPGGGGSDAYVLQLSDNAFTVSGTLDPSLTFTLGSTLCDLGHFSTTQTKFCTHTMSAQTNATNGYTISYVPTTTLTSGANTIDAMPSPTASVVASEQFGMNLKANTAAGSFTSTDFGADPSGGSGSVYADYDVADLFKFNTSGDPIALATTPTNVTTYTVSFITNIEYVTEAGTYSTPVTYTIVPSF